MSPTSIESHLQELTDNESSDFREIYRSTGTLPVTRRAMEQLVDLAVGYMHRGAAPNPTRRDAALQRYRRRGLQVSGISDIRGLSPEDVDAVAGQLGFRYQAMALGDTVPFASAGVPGALAGLPALLGLSLRAVGEIATHYGFDATRAWERKFALLVLTTAVVNRPLDGESAAELARLMKVVPQQHENSELPEKLEERIAQALVLHLVRDRLRGNPRSNVAFNKEFVDCVCETVRRIYRERWLFERYRDRAAAAAE